MKNWKLKDVYLNRKHALEDLSSLQNLCDWFSINYSKRMKHLNAKELADAIKLYSDIKRRICCLESYSYLLYSTNLLNNTICNFHSRVKDGTAMCIKKIVFFETEFKRVNSKTIEKLRELITEGEKSWLDKLLKNKVHSLSPEVEEVYVEYDAQKDVWLHLYDQIRSQEVYEIEGKQYSEAELDALLQSSDANLRQLAGRAKKAAYAKYNEMFTTIFNAITNNNLTIWKAHNYHYPEHLSNLKNDLSKEELDAMVSTVVKSAKDISVRYYKLKAKIFGVKKLSYWDRNAPYPNINVEEDISIEEAEDIILETFTDFHPRFGEIAKKLIEDQHIDYYPERGKDTGAYCMEMPVDIDPFIFLNYNGKNEDVDTFAHELGHGVHEVLSKKQGELGRNKSVGQAELASIFGETLVFRKRLSDAQDLQMRFKMLSNAIEREINTTFRQISFHLFEAYAYRQRKLGKLTSAKLNENFERHLAHPFGDSVSTRGVNVLWASVSHFFQMTPFYVYSYCFSSILVNALIEVYESKKIPDFAEKYMELLEKGGTQSWKEMLAEFGIDCTSPSFWENGLLSMQRNIDQLEDIAKQLYPNINWE